MNLQQIESSLQAMKNHCQEARGAKNLLLDQQKKFNDELSDTRREIKLLDQEQAVLNHTSRVMMEDLTSKIEEPVSMALQLLWGDDREFRFKFGEYRGEPAAWREVLKREEGGEFEAFDPDEQSGGGVSDIVSFILDLSIMRMIDPPVTGPVSRDEPAKHVDRQNGDSKTENIAFFLKEYVRQAGIQFLFITHNDSLENAADRVYAVKKVKEMTSKVERVK